MELLAGVKELFNLTAEYYTTVQSGTIPTAMVSEMIFSKFYDKLVKHEGDIAAAAFLFGAENQALRAEKALFDLAVWAKEQATLADYLLSTPAETIGIALQASPAAAPLSSGFADRFRAYLAEYGHAIYDLDFARPVPAEEPAPLLEALKVYLEGKNNPHERQRLARERQRPGRGCDLETPGLAAPWMVPQAAQMGAG